MTLKRSIIILLIAAALLLIGAGVPGCGDTDKKVGGSSAGDGPPMVSDSAAVTAVSAPAGSTARPRGVSTASGSTQRKRRKPSGATRYGSHNTQAGEEHRI
jgi:hypothetical protein